MKIRHGLNWDNKRGIKITIEVDKDGQQFLEEIKNTAIFHEDLMDEELAELLMLRYSSIALIGFYKYPSYFRYER